MPYRCGRLILVIRGDEKHWSTLANVTFLQLPLNKSVISLHSWQLGESGVRSAIMRWHKISTQHLIIQPACNFLWCCQRWAEDGFNQTKTCFFQGSITPLAGEGLVSLNQNNFWVTWNKLQSLFSTLKIKSNLKFPQIAVDYTTATKTTHSFHPQVCLFHSMAPEWQHTCGEKKNHLNVILKLTAMEVNQKIVMSSRWLQKAGRKIEQKHIPLKSMPGF